MIRKRMVTQWRPVSPLEQDRRELGPWLLEVESNFGIPLLATLTRKLSLSASGEHLSGEYVFTWEWDVDAPELEMLTVADPPILP